MVRKKKRSKRTKGPPAPRARDSFYLVEVTDFSLAGGASAWDPDVFPDVYARQYLRTPDRTVLHEDLGLHLVLRPVDPPMPEITTCFASLHGERRRPKPDAEFYGGMIDKRKETLKYWFHSSLDLTKTLASALIAGRTVFVRFQGSRLYRGRACLCGIDWWTSDHPDLLAELGSS